MTEITRNISFSQGKRKENEKKKKNTIFRAETLWLLHKALVETPVKYSVHLFAHISSWDRSWEERHCRQPNLQEKVLCLSK